MKEKSEITPDSFFNDVRRLRKEIDRQSDASSKAIYGATLAHILMQNTHRSQARRRDTVSHPDSIEEWSREEYTIHSATLYKDALQDMDLLYSAQTKKWLPLVLRGKDEKVFGSSMLHVVWQAMCDDISYEERNRLGLPGFGSIIELYGRHGLREAVLRLSIDSIQQTMYGEKATNEYLRLKEEFKDLKACDMVYQQLANRTSPDSAAKVILKEGLSRYPKSSRLYNMLSRMEAPEFSYNAPLVFYPETKTPLYISSKNIHSMEQAIYRLPDDFASREHEDLLSDVRREGRLVQKNVFTIPQHREDEMSRDTLEWLTPAVGVYAMVTNANTKIRLQEKPTPVVHPFYVSRLNIMTNTMPDGKTQIIVTDGISGEPREGVTIELSTRQNNGTEKHVGILHTDKRGIAVYNSENSGRLIVKAYKDDDMAMANMGERNITVYHSKWRTAEDARQRHLNIYTDRSIYRPGQTVYIGAVAYDQKGWDAQTAMSHNFSIDLLDGNNRKVDSRTLKTDEFGVASDSIQLPSDARPGQYRISSTEGTAYIRVEEYRRPTFHVEMDPAPALSMPADSITLSGKATTYSGVPVSGARVTSKTSFNNSFWEELSGGSSDQRRDTVTTDAEGRFKVNIPLKGMKERIHYGMRLLMNVDVLSRNGETQQGRIAVSLCSRPYLLRGTIPGKIDKENITPWTFDLLSSTGKSIEGQIRCRVMNENEEVCRFELPAGKPSLPIALKDVPSGRYTLEAEYGEGDDTARHKCYFSLFSINDTRLTGKQDLSIYCPCDTFQTGSPVKMQIGTTLRRAWIYCTMTTADKVVMDTLMCLSDTAVVWELPYRKEYGKAVTLSTMVYHDGMQHRENVTLFKPRPDNKLTLHWDTFRDRLRPGQQEEWRLTLTRPDGSPASANLLLSMYDASLDAIRNHGIAISYSRPYNIRMADYQPNNYFCHDWWYRQDMLAYTKPEKDFSLSSFNPEYTFGFMFHDAVYLREGGKHRILYSTAAMPMKANAKPVLQGQIAGLDSRAGDVVYETSSAMKMVAEDAEEEAGLNGTDDFSFRGKADDAFSETAFFRPMLRTDGKGAACISFTMPESLTTWHLAGFAHTRDMMIANIDKSVVAQKELMAELVLPRFLRNGDEATFTASIHNVSDSRQTGRATCTILDAETEKVLQQRTFRFDMEGKTDTTYTLSYKATLAHQSLVIRWKAISADCSDGEQRPLAVLSDMECITETRAFQLYKPGTTDFDLSGLFSHNSPLATNRSMTVEYTTRPMWLAVRSLPSLFTPHCSNVLCQTSSYYAATLAKHILDEVPDAEACLIADSLHYEDMLSLDHRMQLLTSISDLQQPDGSLAWFPGMRGSSYMTREVAYMLVRLRKMGVRDDAATNVADRILYKAVDYLSASFHDQVKEMREEKTYYIGLPTMQYLYILDGCGKQMSKEEERDAKHLCSKLAAKTSFANAEEAALAALVLKMYEKKKPAAAVMEELHKRLEHKDGYYISYPGGSFTSIDRKLQSHVQIMEAVREVEPERTDIINGMTEWLLLQKRTQQWDDPVRTVNAVYALLLDSYKPLTDRTQDVLKLRDGQQTIRFRTPDTADGYLRDSVSVKRPARLSVEKRSEGLSWGVVYATFEMPADKATADWQGFHIRRDVSNPNPATGDRIHVRYTITAERDYDFVHLFLPRPAAAEPVQMLSGYCWQGGMGYYREIHDACTDYFCDTMPRGTYILEEDWLISRQGSYIMAPCKIECNYAPEYQSHTEGGRLSVR